MTEKLFTGTLNKNQNKKQNDLWSTHICPCKCLKLKFKQLSMTNNLTLKVIYLEGLCLESSSEAFMDCHIVVSPIIFSHFNKLLLRILFLIEPVTTTYFFFKNAPKILAGPLNLKFLEPSWLLRKKFESLSLVNLFLAHLWVPALE